ncbi:MAG: hypothetical protein ACT4OG_09970 [Alphaproteobacteria bacterium]
MPLNDKASDFFSGLVRTHRRLQDEVTKDDVHHFVVDAWHLIENVEKDQTTTKQQRKLAASLRSDPLMRICEELCNEEKHRNSKPVSKTNGWVIERGYGMGRYGKGAYGVGEESIILKCSDGTTLNALDFTAEVMTKLRGLFSS